MHGTARRRGRDLAQRNEAQGGRWGCAIGHTTRHVRYKRLNRFYPKSSLENSLGKNLQMCSIAGVGNFESYGFFLKRLLYPIRMA